MGRMVIRSAIDGSLGYGRPECDASRSTPVLIEPSLTEKHQLNHLPRSARFAATRKWPTMKWHPVPTQKPLRPAPFPRLQTSKLIPPGSFLDLAATPSSLCRVSRTYPKQNKKKSGVFFSESFSIFQSQLWIWIYGFFIFSILGKKRIVTPGKNSERNPIWQLFELFYRIWYCNALIVEPRKNAPSGITRSSEQR